MTPAAETDWYLQDWLQHFGLKQTWLVTDVGLNKSTANHLFHGHQPYRREHVNRIAGQLGLRPFELLLPPDEAIAIRKYRESVATLAAVAESGRPFVHDQIPPKRTTTTRR